MNLGLDGKRAIVTGGSGGIGFAVEQKSGRLARTEMRARDEEAVSDVRRDLEFGSGVNAHAAQTLTQPRATAEVGWFRPARSEE